MAAVEVLHYPIALDMEAAEVHSKMGKVVVAERSMTAKEVVEVLDSLVKVEEVERCLKVKEEVEVHCLMAVVAEQAQVSMLKVVRAEEEERDFEAVRAVPGEFRSSSEAKVERIEADCLLLAVVEVLVLEQEAEEVVREFEGRRTLVELRISKTIRCHPSASSEDVEEAVVQDWIH
jgi:hypothetical protein